MDVKYRTVSHNDVGAQANNIQPGKNQQSENQQNNSLFYFLDSHMIKNNHCLPTLTPSLFQTESDDYQVYH